MKIKTKWHYIVGLDKLPDHVCPQTPFEFHKVFTENSTVVKTKMKTKTGKVKIVVGKAGAQKGNIYWKVYGANGELICASEGYTSRTKAWEGFRSALKAMCGHPQAIFS